MSWNTFYFFPYEERTGNESVVYFTRKLSAEGLIKAYEQENANIEGKVDVKLHRDIQYVPTLIDLRHGEMRRFKAYRQITSSKGPNVSHFKLAIRCHNIAGNS